MDRLEQAVSEARAAVDAASNEDPDWGDLLATLASRLGDKFTATQDAVDIEEAIRVSRKAVGATQRDHVFRPDRLLFLTYLLYDRFKLAGEMDDLDEAISIAQQAVDETPKDHPKLVMCFKVLRHRIRDKYATTGTTVDLEKAIDVGSQAMQLTPDNHEDRSTQFGDISALLASRYSSTGAMDDLESAIQMVQNGIDLVPEDDHSERPSYLQQLGGFLGLKSLRTGSLADLEQGIRYVREAMAIPLISDEDRGGIFNALGHLMASRYAVTGALADINEAISLTRQAIDAPSDSLIVLSQRLGNLAVQLQQRFLRTKAGPDLEESTQLSKSAMEILPDGHPDQSRHQHDLGIKLARKFGITHNMADLEEGIRCIRLALDKMPHDHPNRAVYLHSLTNGLIQKGAETFEPTDVEEWIVVAKEAISLIPENHADRGELLYSLGLGRLTACAVNKTSVGIDEAITCFNSALHQPNAPTLCRIQACMSLLPINPDRKQSLEAAKLAMGLVPRLTPRSLDNDDRQNSLGEIAGLACDAAAVAIQTEDPLTALDLLEQGQGLLGASLEEIRTDVLDLREAHPELAEDFERLRDELGRAVSMDQATDGLASREGQALRRYDAGKEFDELVEDIRQLPKFKTFLRAPRLVEMQRATDRGPIALINVSVIHCDVILITRDYIEARSLCGLSLETIREKVLIGDRGSPQVLEWLWDTIAGPVLDALGFTQPLSEDDDWPHVWWIPTGLLRQFPLHAAGYHKKQSGETVIDRVMSSYGSSVKAILRGRQRRASPNGSTNAVLVAMEHTPVRSNLPFVGPEIKVVRSLCASMGLSVVEPDRRKQEVVATLRTSRIFHFAGHGSTNQDDPLQSFLCLEDVIANPLRVADLLDLNLKENPPFLAYLSACGTGRIQHEQLMDESMHLVSACQLAGFRHVIGTLWEVNDEICVEMARITYEGMRDGQMDDESVCRGLHTAIRRLRDRWVDDQQQGESRGGTRDRSGVAKSPASYGSRWVRKRTRVEAKGRKNYNFGTKWVRVSGKPGIKGVGTATASQRSAARGNWEEVIDILGRDATLAIGQRFRKAPPPTWVPFVHYGV
ncbi:CHAT domain-containing protein [Fusarium solani]|uniref:CHAT domain-containing protein n=1 Tax=Fusarium solani TaxID=169388 RepID=A0A9P9G1F0_FUSSL|nr:CHAT domain-containing protein [Fusarium solani]KAH7230721.1 CHAT domain-containing protein [Fusarium solani]